MSEVDTDLIEFYQSLIIKQYYDKPLAREEIGMKAAKQSEVFTLLQSIPTAFDIDNAVKSRLDIIGKVVGLGRGDLPAEYQNDENYRLLLKGKIAVNNSSAFLVRDDRTSMQDVADLIFNGSAQISDNYDMTLDVVVDETVDIALLQVLIDLDLMPRGQGVSYRDIIVVTTGDIFGFANNPSTFGFSVRSNPAIIGGKFSRRLL